MSSIITLQKNSYFIKTVFVILLFASIQIITSQITVSGPSSATSIPANTAKEIAPLLTITSSERITDFTKSIIDSYTTNDQLGNTGSLPSGITVTPWSSTTLSIVFNGTTSAAVWQTFLRTVTITQVTFVHPKRDGFLLPLVKLITTH